MSGYSELWEVFSFSPKNGFAFIREFTKFDDGREEDTLFYRTWPPYQESDIITPEDESPRESLKHGFVSGSEVMKPNQFTSYPNALDALTQLSVSQAV